jgi:dienelactone hydrolase
MRLRDGVFGVAMLFVATLWQSTSAAEGERHSNPRYRAGSSTLCVVDESRGFDETAGITAGARLILVEAWYPVEAARAERYSKVKFGDYFAGDRDLLLRTERALLTLSGFAPELVERYLALAPAQFDVERDSFRDAPIAHRSEPFPVVIYSHGTLQQRFTNDSMAEQLAQRGYVVLAPEHTGNDALAPLGAFCPEELAQPGVVPVELANNPAFDAARGEYIGQRFEPFFLAGSPDPATGNINPAEVALTLERVGDYRAALKAAKQRFGQRVRIGRGTVGLVGYSRGAMHGLVGAELMEEIGASVGFVEGTPLLFYSRDVQAAPINRALSQQTRGKRTVLDRLTKPVLEIIGGEDTRRKATTDIAAAMGVYPTPSALNPSPIVRDTFDTLGHTFGALVEVTDIDHFDFVDDPFVIAYRAQGGVSRTGAFDASKVYAARAVSQRQAIRDYYVQALFEVYLRGRHGKGHRGPLFENPFAGAGVSTEYNSTCD